MVECNGCTLCCKTTNIVYMNSPHDEYCEKCKPGVGCTIHAERPEPCKVFQCCYLQMDRVHPALRPDKCGVIFEKIKDNLILGTTINTIDTITPLIMGQINSFIKESISVFYQQFNPYKYICYHVAGVNKNEIINSLRKKANDSTKLHRRLN